MFSSLGTATLDVVLVAQCLKLQALSMCVCLPRGNIAPLPLHDALTCKAGRALGDEHVPVASD